MTTHRIASTVAAALTAAAIAVPATASAAPAATPAFTTPTGETCTYAAGEVTCKSLIRGEGMQLTSDGAASTWSGTRNPLFGSAPVTYGQTVRTGDVTCQVSLAGLRCSSSRTGHGFVLSGFYSARF